MSLLALIHANEGPIVAIRRVERPAIRVSSLPRGSFLTVDVYQRSGATSSVMIASNGDHPLEKGEWLRVTYTGAKGHKTICCVVNQKAA